MSDLNYIEYNFKVVPVQPAAEILMAELAERNFESFVEQENGLLAYIKKEDWNEDVLGGVSILDNLDFKITFEAQEIEQENWNATWEQNFEPIEVEDLCRVRAPFHEKLDFEYDIVIEPKMSFGTGHHETTQMMLKHILYNDFESRSVLDMGSGTGVLAILSEMKGAVNIDAVDIDHWCFLNAKENIERNNCTKISAYEGDANFLGKNLYDIILANINRNILLRDIPKYAKCLNEDGLLFLSGFYEDDLPTIIEKCQENNIYFKEKYKEGEWISAKFQRKS